MERRSLLVFLILVMLFGQIGLFARCSDGELKIRYAGDMGVDTNGNGLFDYLQIRVEVNITTPGTYMLEVQDLLDSSGEPINASADSNLTLGQGEQVITIDLDGRTIYSSGRNPYNISYIGLISQDYGVAGFLTDVRLTKEYRFSEFEPPPKYSLGVKEGDWVEYNVLRLSSSNDPQQQPVTYPTTMVVNVQSVHAKVVYAKFSFVDPTGGVSSNDINGYPEEESPIFPFIIPANLTASDSLAHLTNTTINGTRSGNVLGNIRDINYFQGDSRTVQSNVTFLLRGTYVWDKVTGFLISSWMNMTMTDPSTGYVSYTNVSIVLSYSNVIRQKTSIILGAATSMKLGDTLNVTATLLDSYNRSIVNQDIVFSFADSNTQIGKGATTYNGTQIQYTPDKPGNYTIMAAFRGSDALLPCESLIEVKVTSDVSYTIPIAVSVVAVVLVTGSAVYLLRKRRNSS